jgi:ribosomal protein L28
MRAPRSRIPIKRKTWRLTAYPKVPSGIPAFAAQPFYTYKLRNKSLMGGKTIRFGNNVSKFSNRTPRVWIPNIRKTAPWSEALGRRVSVRIVVSVLRTIDKVGGLDAYLTGSKRRRMKHLGPRGWEIRAAVIKAIREKERAKYLRILQRSILLCPRLTINSEWTDLRPFLVHTEGYAVLPEQDCKLAFETLMKRLREGRSAIRQVRRYEPRTIALPDYYARKLAQRVNAGDGKAKRFIVPEKEQAKARRALEAKQKEEKELVKQRAKEARIPRKQVKRLRRPAKVRFPKRKVIA